MFEALFYRDEREPRLIRRFRRSAELEGPTFQLAPEAWLAVAARAESRNVIKEAPRLDEIDRAMTRAH
jgi:hypothetical protein